MSKPVVKPPPDKMRRKLSQALAMQGINGLAQASGMAALIVTGLPPDVAAQPASIHDHLPWIPKMREDLGESRRVLKQKVTLEIAPLVDNGNVVPMSVSVQKRNARR